MTAIDLVSYIKGYNGYTPVTVIKSKSLDIRNRKETVTEDKLNEIGKMLEGITL
jgi:hypothetical protein